MRPTSLLILLLPFLGGVPAAQEVRPPRAEPRSAFRELRETLAELRRVRQDTEARRRAWKREERELQAEADALSRRIAALEERLRTLTTRHRALTAAAAGRREERRRLTAAAAEGGRHLQAFLRWLAAFEERSLPPGRRARRERVAALGRETGGVTRRLERVLAYVYRRLAEARTVDLCTDTVRKGRETRLVRGVRVGLVLGLAAPSEGGKAYLAGGETVPSWRPAPGLAARVAAIRGQLLRRRSPAVVTVPFPTWALRERRRLPPPPRGGGK